MTIIRISALWCSSCLFMKSRYDKIFTKYNLNVIDYDYDTDYDKIVDYKVGPILPVVVFLDNNNELFRITGEKSNKYIEQLLEESIL